MMDFTQKLAGLRAKGSPNVCAVIAAAGSGSRMNFPGGSGKLFIELGGKPVIERTLEAFGNCNAVDSLIICARRGDFPAMEAAASRSCRGKPYKIVEGGASRQESVERAVAALPPEAGLIAVHDGARCLVAPADIEAVIAEALISGAASAANKLTDTVKFAGEDGLVEGTADRSLLWSVQTPQVFLAELYMDALAEARRAGLSVTDDCSLAEHAGYKVRLVRTSAANIKITFPEDAALAERLLADKN